MCVFSLFFFRLLWLLWNTLFHFICSKYYETKMLAVNSFEFYLDWLIRLCHMRLSSVPHKTQTHMPDEWEDDEKKNKYKMRLTNVDRHSKFLCCVSVYNRIISPFHLFIKIVLLFFYHNMKRLKSILNHFARVYAWERVEYMSVIGLFFFSVVVSPFKFAVFIPFNSSVSFYLYRYSVGIVGVVIRFFSFFTQLCL